MGLFYKDIPKIDLVFKTSLQSFYDAFTALKARDEKARVTDARLFDPFIYIGDVYKLLNYHLHQEIVKKVDGEYSVPLAVTEYFKQRGITITFHSPKILSIDVKGRELRIFLDEGGLND